MIGHRRRRSSLYTRMNFSPSIGLEGAIVVAELRFEATTALYLNLPNERTPILLARGGTSLWISLSHPALISWP